MDVKFAWDAQRTTTPEGVYRVLRAAILDGQVPPGGQLREAYIASDLGISRSPLREALTRLEEEGLVVKIPFRGAFVVEVSAHDVAEIASIRLRVEPFAGELSMAAIDASVASVGASSSCESASIRAMSRATFPFPITTARSAERSNSSCW